MTIPGGPLYDWEGHEVPTHVDSSDRVFLGLTFIQVIMLVVVCGGCYALYVMPMLAWIPSKVRIGMVIPIGLFGAAMLIVQINGRPIPMVLLNILRFRVSPKLYRGSPSDLLHAAPENLPAFSEASPPPPTPVHGLFRWLRSARLSAIRSRQDSREQTVWPKGPPQ